MSVLFTIMIVSLQFLSVSLFSAVLQLTSLVLHVSRWAVVVRVAVEMIDESGHPADRSVVPVRTVDYWGRRRWPQNIDSNVVKLSIKITVDKKCERHRKGR